MSRLWGYLLGATLLVAGGQAFGACFDECAYSFIDVWKGPYEGQGSEPGNAAWACQLSGGCQWGVMWYVGDCVGATRCAWAYKSAHHQSDGSTFYIGYWYQRDGCPAGTQPNLAGICVDPDAASKNEGAPDVCADTNPINILFGNKYQHETDFRGNRPFPLSVQRSYNSYSGTWRFLPAIEIVSEGTSVRVVRGDGKRFPFQLDAGVWQSDPDVTGTLQATQDAQSQITGWIYTTEQDNIETYDGDGRLLGITNRNGHSHSYSYATDTITVAHSLGGQLLYQSDTQGRISGFTDPEGNTYQYTWDAGGRLIAVTYPGGESRTYHYEHSIYPDALTGLTDEKGERLATWWYDNDGRATWSEHAGGAERVSIDYTYLDHATDPRVTVTSALGRQSTYHVTTLHGVNKVTEVEGHPTDNCAGANKAYSYDANGFLASKTDWNGNLTTYVHNARGLQTSRTEAVGTPQERTITTEWHADYRVPIRITEPEKIIALSYDAQGRLLTRTERAAP